MNINVILSLILALSSNILAFRPGRCLRAAVKVSPMLMSSLYTGSAGSSPKKDPKKKNLKNVDQNNEENVPAPPTEDKRKGVQKQDEVVKLDDSESAFGGRGLLEPDYQEDAWGAPIGPLPTVSSKINWEEVEVKDELAELYIVGAGTMGSELARQMVEMLGDEAEDKVVVAETLTDARHDELLSYGTLPKLREDRTEDDEYASRNVIVCIPPGKANGYQGDYPEELADAFRLWAGPKGGGLFILVSSTAIYGESDQNTVTETFRVDSRSARSTRAIEAEAQVLERDGTIIRLAGLYNDQRGPHNYWCEKIARGETIDGDSDGIVNMLHYHDAASVAVQCIKSGSRSTVYLASDGNPISRMDMCHAAIASKLYPLAEGKPVTFSGMAGYAKGKTVDCSWTETTLDWSPKYPSFNSYMRRLGGEDCPDPVKEKKGDKQGESSILWMPGDDEDWAL